MKYDIKVEQISDFPEAEFVVEVVGEETTTHRVTLDEEYYNRLTRGKISPRELVKESFSFLLERESNAMILHSFDLRKITTYFPEFEEEIKSRINT
ncbi:MAG: hypothetical protein U5L75_00520 [Candidatus Campbellbacteria bacterium]|nr:hypothetical protein [Candidatus Campbellbacteria bacterium]